MKADPGTERRLSGIQSLRGLAALMVFVFHYVGLQPLYCFVGGQWIRDWVDLGSAGVDIFFAISGFIMVQVTRGRERSWRLSLRFLMERVGRIYPMYWIWLGLAIVLYLRHPGWIAKLPTYVPHYWASALLWPEGNAPILTVGWTLIHEMYFYLVFGLLLLVVPAKGFGYALSLWGLSVLCLRIGFPKADHPVWQIATHPLTLEFVAGALIGLRFGNGMGAARSPYRNLIEALLLLPLLHLVRLHLALGLSSEWQRVLCDGIPAALIVAATASLELRPGFRAPAWMVRIGDASYSLYLCHVPVILVGYGWLRANGRFCLQECPLPGLLVGISAIAIGMASHYFLEKPIQRGVKRIIFRIFRDPAPSVKTR